MPSIGCFTWFAWPCSCRCRTKNYGICYARCYADYYPIYDILFHQITLCSKGYLHIKRFRNYPILLYKIIHNFDTVFGNKKRVSEALLFLCPWLHFSIDYRWFFLDFCCNHHADSIVYYTSCTFFKLISSQHWYK